MTTAELVTNTNEQEHTERAPLYNERETNDLRTRWQNIQGTFVDDPRASVAQARRKRS